MRLKNIHMFSTPTTFILGAGASWHYGYPTGEKLVQDMIEMAERYNGLSTKIENRVNDRYGELGLDIKPHLNSAEGYADFVEQCKEIAQRLRQSNPLVIDYFLEQNKGLQEVGKILIACVILKCEQAYLKGTPYGGSYNPNRGRKPRDHKDDWYRFLLYQLTLDCKKPEDLLENKLTFVTFNYDTSLEQELYRGLKANELFTQKEGIIDQFLSDERFIHVYGKVNGGVLPFPRSTNFDDNLIEAIELYKRARDAATSIRTIQGDDKENGNNALKKARSAIGMANRIYLLGYGFDHINNQRLQLRENLQYSPQDFNFPDLPEKRIFFTNFEDSKIINKRAGLLFFDDVKKFTPPALPIHGEWKQPPYYEKSIRNVYDAFQYDFDLQSG